MWRRDYRDRSRYEQNYRNDFRRGNFRENVRTNQTYRGQNYRGGYRRNYHNENYKRGRSRSRERQYPENTRRNDRNSNSRSRSFSLRDEIGMCPNIEVEIAMSDKSPFLIRLYHIKEENKNFIEKEMKRLYYLGILKEGFSAYPSPGMLISRKVTRDKRVVTDFKTLKCENSLKQLGISIVKRYIFGTR